MARVVEGLAELFRQSLAEEFEATRSRVLEEFEGFRDSILQEFEESLKLIRLRQNKEVEHTVELRKMNKDLGASLSRERQERREVTEKFIEQNDALQARLHEACEQQRYLQASLEESRKELSRERELRQSRPAVHYISPEEKRQWQEKAFTSESEEQSSQDEGPEAEYVLVRAAKGSPAAVASDGSAREQAEAGGGLAQASDTIVEKRKPLWQRSMLIEAVKDATAATLKLSRSSVRADRPLADLGLDSSAALRLRDELCRRLDVDLPPLVFLGHQTINEVVDHGLLRGPQRPTAAAAPGPGVRTPAALELAVVSAACDFPRGPALESYWAALAEQRDVVVEVPFTRWDHSQHHNSAGTNSAKTYARHGGFIDGAELFDAAFFGVSAAEAQVVDPQQRLLLTTAYRSLLGCGYDKSVMPDSSIGVFVALSNLSWCHMTLSDVGAFAGTGTSSAIAANRVSYVFGFMGPSMTIDTACSSSLSALGACKCCLLAESTLREALLAGSDLMHGPNALLIRSAVGLLSRVGRCMTFNATADGYVRGEGSAAISLKRCCDAEAGRYTVLAEVRSAAMNQDGRSSSLTAPSGAAQEAVLLRALEEAQAQPQALHAVECHGTGTPLGDPIEVGALRAVMGSSDGGTQQLLLGAGKTNIGHLEAVSGFAGLLKVCGSLRYHEVPPNLHYSRLNPHIDLGECRLAIPQSRTALAESKAMMGVSSFGSGGTNAHAVLTESRAPPERHARELKVAFLFTGQGSQRRDMGRQLYHADSAFRAALDRCVELCKDTVPENLLDVLFAAGADAASRLNRALYSQLALFSLEYALAEMWRARGVVPFAVCGHSAGEYAAAVAAGAMPLQDALKVIVARGRLIEELCDPTVGGVVALFVAEADVRAAISRAELRGGVAVVAAVNGPLQTVVSGHIGALNAVCSVLKADHKFLPIPHAMHSPLIAPVLPGLRKALASCRLGRPSTCRVVSAVTGKEASEELCQPEHWLAIDEARPVLFARAVEELECLGCNAFLEVGPDLVLVKLARQCVRGNPEDYEWLPSLQRGLREVESMLLVTRALGVAFDRPTQLQPAPFPWRPPQSLRERGQLKAARGQPSARVRSLEHKAPQLLALMAPSPAETPSVLRVALPRPFRPSARGNYWLWLVKCARGFASATIKTTCLRLFESPFSRKTFEGVELDMVLLGRELDSDWLEVKAAGVTYCIRRGLSASHGVELEPLRDPSQLLSSPTKCDAFVFEAPMNPEMAHALRAIGKLGATAATSASPCFWRVLERIPIYTEPNLQASVHSAAHPDETVYGRSIGKNWVEVPSTEGTFYLRLTRSDSVTVRCLERCHSATEVLCPVGPRRPRVLELPRPLRLGEGPHNPTVEEVREFASQELVRLGYSSKGEVAVKDISPKNRKYWTFKVELSVDGPIVQHDLFVLRCEVDRSSVSGVLRRVATERHAQAAEVFHRHGLAPERYSAGAGWYLEAFLSGWIAKEFHGLAGRSMDVKLIAGLLARVHGIPVDWYEGWAKLSRGLWSWMRSVDASSHVWAHTCHPEDLARISEEDLHLWAHAKLFHPVSSAAKKLVTTHGDFCLRNMVVDRDGKPTMVIDLERACVAFAVEDLSVFVSECCPRLEQRRAFLREYLMHMGCRALSQDVDDLLLDCRIYRLSAKWLRKDPLLEDMKQVVRIVRNNLGPFAGTLREKIITGWLTEATTWYHKQFEAKDPSRDESSPSVRSSRSSSLPPPRHWGSPSLARSSSARSLGTGLLQGQLEEALKPSLQELALVPASPMATSASFRVPNLLDDDRNRKLELTTQDERIVVLNHTWPSLFLKLLQHPEVTQEAILTEVLGLAARTRPASISQYSISGPLWLVVRKKGILVRRGLQISSESFRIKLALGTVVQELEKDGKRLKYERLRGDGPDIGWVSMQAEGHDLLLALPELESYLLPSTRPREI